MNAPVSVIIPFSPAHTPEEMLAEAKESVRNQSVSTKIIVVEDADQQGPAWARNVGLERAETKYVAFLDADDLWQPDKLERQLERIDETGAGLCVEGTPMSTEEFVRKLFVSELGSLTPSVVLDTDKVDVRFEESLERREDHLFMLEAAQQAGVCLCENLVTVRKQESGLSANMDTELRMDADLQFLSLACRRIPRCKQYLTEFHYYFYFRTGRAHHYIGNYCTAASYLFFALRLKIRLKAIAAVLLSLCYLVVSWLSSVLRSTK